MTYIVRYEMRFEWDAEKDRANRRKHGLSFDQAAELFKAGVDYLEVYDEAHSSDEDRSNEPRPDRRRLHRAARRRPSNPQRTNGHGERTTALRRILARER